jgi:spore germination cell wall hydrolase CwlJ-like protein
MTHKQSYTRNYTKKLIVAIALLGLLNTSPAYSKSVHIKTSHQVVQKHKQKKLKGPKITNTNEVSCMAQNILHEAGGESIQGQKAVAAVTMNRLLSGKFPNSVCKVVYDKGQFAWVGKKGNRSPSKSIIDIAHHYVHHYSKEDDVTKGALYFNSSKNSKWKLYKITKIGGHTFYRNFGDPVAYKNDYIEFDT